MTRIKAIFNNLREIVAWLQARGLGWLAPLVFILVGMGGLLALAAAVPAISPFVYLLF
ncbi:MAG: hypothetical protein H6740_25125 [Alphaproteobacteria bacterium]|nr:hypothetical protein [Alphaproteobacteria bacterium]